MKKIHKYITIFFLKTFFISLAFFVLLFVLSDFFSNLSDIVGNGVSIKYIISYYVYYTPFIIYFSLPFIFALSSLVSLGYLSSKNEIIVMRSSGLSIFKIAKPVLFFSIIVAVLMFASKELIVNYGLEKASFVKHYYFKNKQFKLGWTKVGNMFIKVNGLNVTNNMAYNVTAYRVDKDFNRVEAIITAKRVKFKPKEIIFIDGCSFNMPNFSQGRCFKDFKIKTNKSFYSLFSSSKFKEPSIKSLVFSYKHSLDKDYYLSLIIHRFVYPFSCIILTLISFVFVLKTNPRRGGFVKNVFSSSLVFLVYIGSLELISSMGRYSMVDPNISIVIFILFWLSVSVYNLLKLGV
ncbi:LptF/LptG family permease [Hippea maritima]|uniref:Permease YjgP/YjgQ family protein n=1 Tax=Hippea maritima (strain ATCC 700847 / DSM 10411 / MH2) TaxID=760142 RepID=F2LUF4_HIPMA|nr:LptF/LptG family permease [Hippea maritima]AEA33480.1 permease YjgP/YjgQ family protein [Hippea maritima DSM 10411]